jgi:hypothetical protein
MLFNEHVTQFAGKPVVDWPPESPIADPDQVIYRVSLSWEDQDSGLKWTDRFAEFLDDPAATRTTGIVVGPWGFWDVSVAGVVEALVTARDRLPNLSAIFLGDITYEECEISWITLADISPLFDAYPALEHFCIRGSEKLHLGTLRHAHLKSLVLQNGGLDGSVVRQVAAAQLPQLEHLELWLGTQDYGGTTKVEDLAPIFTGRLSPKLRYLGLRNSEIADEIAVAVARAPILERVRVLDLSLGMLTDVGAAALLASPLVPRLEKLDLHHHYCSDEMMEKLEALGIDVDLTEVERETDQDYRYVAIGE